MKHFFKFSFLAVVLGLALSLAGCSKSPEDVSVEVTKILFSKDGKGSDVMKYIAIPKDAEAANIEMVEGKMNQAIVSNQGRAKAKKGVESITTQKAQINGDKAVVPVTVTFKDGSKQEEKYNLSKIDGNWKLELK